MRIVIDLQGAQTESRFRGIGRYSMSLTKEMVKNKGEHEIIIALNGLFPETIEPIRAEFDGLLPQENIRVWYAPGPVRECEPENEWRRQAAELIRESFLGSLKPDIIFVTSLFEGYLDDAVTSIGVFDEQTPVFSILYDFIPLVNSEHYLTPNPTYKKHYLNKINHLKKAKSWLSISKATAKEAKEFIGNNEKHIVNISTACDDRFCKIEVSKEKENELSNRYHLSQPFILYTGGSDFRKNLHGLIRAYARLPQKLRDTYQLVLAGKMPEGDISKLKKTAKDAGLNKNQVIFTGYVTDEELVQLYNLCKLFVLPSWHEGFGLPVLEAMSCGAPVICGNKSSLPEVICKQDALFDPQDERDMSQKIAQVLSDEEFRQALRDHGLKQAMNFSWADSARMALRSLEDYVLENGGDEGAVNPTCWVDRTTSYARLTNKVSEYCNASPVSEITKKYAVCLSQNISNAKERQLFVDVSELSQGDAATGVQRVVRSYLRQLLLYPPKDFQVEPVYATREQGYCYARRFTARFLGLSPNDPEIRDEPIRYQVGDVFFALDMQHHVQLAHQDFFQQLRQSGVTVKFMVHDLLPIELADLFYDPNAKELHENWLKLISQTDGAICVSRSTADSFRDWIQKSGLQPAGDFLIDWVHNGGDIESSKPTTGLPEDAHVVLEPLQKRPSFLMVGTIEPRKGHSQTLLAVEELWSRGFDINLVIVGSKGWKMDSLAQKILRHPERGKRLFWLEGISDEYLEKIYAASTCLIAASLNEGFGLPLIEAAKHKIPIIARDIPVFKEVAGEYAYYFSGDEPSVLADALAGWMELYESGQHPASDDMPWSTWKESTERLKSVLLGKNYPGKQLLVDVSELIQRDAGTGIQRVVRSLFRELAIQPPPGFRVEPVYGTPESACYFYARKFINNFFRHQKKYLNDEPIEYSPGDIFFGLDLCPEVQIYHSKYYEQLRNEGVSIYFIVHDLFPALRPDWWATNTRNQQHVKTRFENWLKVVAESTGAICVSQSTADDLQNWINKQQIARNGRPFKIFVSHNGADFKSSQSSEGLPANANSVLQSLESRPSFLMVGTLEPRKGHTQILDAFELLWKYGQEVNLAIVGKPGWMVEKLTKRLQDHPERDNHLFWLQGISDEYLEKIYQASTCLIAASEGEGFGLPLIEAAQHKLPIIARDIPVFLEVAGDHAFYFQGKEPNDLAEAVQEWLKLYSQDKHPKSDDMPWLTWEQSAERLKEIILNKDNTEPSMKRNNKEKSNTDNSSPAEQNPAAIFPITPPLPLPEGKSEQELFDFVTSVRVEDAPEAEMRAYGTNDFRRFVYTYGMARNIQGQCLELGANPYFTTMLLKKFTDLEINLANYFGHDGPGEYKQAVDYIEPGSGEKNSECFAFQHFNIEQDRFPYPDNKFDLVIFAEIIEHLTNDPCMVLREIKRVLKTNGSLILTTPNVARLENITRLINGTNIYDPYSGYGPYGRHNREYNRHELDQLLRFEGYEPTVCFTADVHTNNAQAFCSVEKIAELIRYRENDLGQYIFIKATVKQKEQNSKRPDWLYRSYPEGELE